MLEGTINRRLIEQSPAEQTAHRSSKQDINAGSHTGRDLDGQNQSFRRSGRASLVWTSSPSSRGVTTDLYLRDSVWPSVALKKIVGESLLITDDDLRKGFEANYGPRVRCRAIVLSSLRKAQEVWDKARQKPTADNFGKLAEKYSVEANSRALRGEVPPIQRFGGQPQLEAEAFKLQAGELSGIIQTGATFVILYCEGQHRSHEGGLQGSSREEIKQGSAWKKEDADRDGAKIRRDQAKPPRSTISWPARFILPSRPRACTAFDRPQRPPRPAASSRREGGKGKPVIRDPNMSVDQLIRDSPTP